MTDAEHLVERLLALQVPGARREAGSAFRHDGDGRVVGGDPYHLAPDERARYRQAGLTSR